jgi:hypothetical protein
MFDFFGKEKLPPPKNKLNIAPPIISDKESFLKIWAILNDDISAEDRADIIHSCFLTEETQELLGQIIFQWKMVLATGTEYDTMINQAQEMIDKNSENRYGITIEMIKSIAKQYGIKLKSGFEYIDYSLRYSPLVDRSVIQRMEQQGAPIGKNL